MVDKSSSLGSVANFDKELSFIARFVDGFNIGQGPRDVRVGVISFSTDARLEFGLSSYNDKSSLLNALLNIDFSLGNTYTHKAFEVLLNQGFSTSTRPSTVPRVGKSDLLHVVGISEIPCISPVSDDLYKNSWIFPYLENNSQLFCLLNIQKFVIFRPTYM